MTTPDPDSPPAPNAFGLLDAFFVATFVAFALTSFLFDRTAALDIVAPDSADPFARAVYWYGMKYDPLVAANPLFLQVMSGISAFVFGPIYLYLAHGILRRRPSIRIPAIAYAITMLYSMVVHLAVELFGDLPPPDLLVFTAVYAIYLVTPVLLLWRFRPRAPFG
jgi:hypothetical protein